MACLLWEQQFYEDGASIADRIGEAARRVPAATLAAIAIEARTVHNLRHVPLLLVSVLAETGKGTPIVQDTVVRVVQRADEIGELLAVHAHRCGVSPKAVKPVLTHGLRKGLARAFRSFDEYQLAKWDRGGVIKLRDALFLCHAKPADDDQAALWKRLIDGELATPDTWEVGLSTGGDKRETFERLLREGKLGYLALLRNLRTMTEVGVDPDVLCGAILARKGAQRVLPFRYVAAARACPQLEPEIDQALAAAIADMPPLPGRTIMLVDVSGSMRSKLSSRSDLTRMDAAAALASIVRGDVRVFSFSARGCSWAPGKGRSHDGTTPVLVEVPPRRGMAGVDAVIGSQEHGGTMLGQAIREANDLPHDRLIVITDEQSHDPVPDPVADRAYMINVASARNGVGYGRWTRIDGFSESVLRFIVAHEERDDQTGSPG
ncbi:TROVE domain-containing protein [Roseospira navarrensis]|nr:TROVE domain-containing protein [Roseospira navarrensis]